MAAWSAALRRYSLRYRARLVAVVAFVVASVFRQHNCPGGAFGLDSGVACVLEVVISVIALLIIACSVVVIGVVKVLSMRARASAIASRWRNRDTKWLDGIVRRYGWTEDRYAVRLTDSLAEQLLAGPERA